MNKEKITEKIRHILEPARKPPYSFYRNSTSGVIEFRNEQVELLLALESKIDSQMSKDYFWQLLGYNFLWPVPNILKSAFLPAPNRRAFSLIRQHCDITAMVFIKAARTDEVLDGLLERIKNYNSLNESSNKIIYVLYTVALNEPILFSDGQLRKIEVLLERLQNCIDQVIQYWNKQTQEQEQRKNAPVISEVLSKALFGDATKQTQPVLPSSSLIKELQSLVVLLKNGLIDIRFERVKEELKGVSSAINQDKNQLISKYSDLGLGKDLIEALEKIDVETEETGSKFKYSQSIGFVRNIYEESLRQIALKIRDATGVAIPKWTDNKGKMGEAIDYFKHIKFILDKEEKLLTGFSGIISDTGSHSLTSERYEVRIAKNILVEICSYLVDKIDNYLKSLPKDKI